MLDQRFYDAAIRDVVGSTEFTDDRLFDYAVEQRARVLKLEKALEVSLDWFQRSSFAIPIIRAALSNGTQRGAEDGSQ